MTKRFTLILYQDKVAFDDVINWIKLKANDIIKLEKINAKIFSIDLLNEKILIFPDIYLLDIELCDSVSYKSKKINIHEKICPDRKFVYIGKIEKDKTKQLFSFIDKFYLA